MMLSEVGASRGRSGRKSTGRTTSHGREVRTISPKVVAMADVQGCGSSGEGGQADKVKIPIPVTFWGPDGSCYEGMSPHVSGEVIFIESEQLLPVETEVTISFTPPDDVLVNRGVAKGTVVWRCISSDYFKSRKGFGVRLQDRWPHSLGSTGNDGSKEAA